MRFLELWGEAGWTFKVYGIAYGRQQPREELIEAAKDISREQLGRTADNDNHYGLGFLGVHDGREANFVFLDYWRTRTNCTITSTCHLPKTQPPWRTVPQRD